MPRWWRWRLASLYLTFVLGISQSVPTSVLAGANSAAIGGNGAAVGVTLDQKPDVVWSDPSAAGIPGTSQFTNAPGLDPPAPLFVVRAKRGGPIVRTGPSETATPLSGLYFDTYLTVVGQATDSTGVTWYSVHLWGSLRGWLRADQTETGDPAPLAPQSASPTIPASSPAPVPSTGNVIPLSAHGVVREQYNVRDAPTPEGRAVGEAQPGDKVTIQAFQSDVSGSVWYGIADGSLAGWIWGGGVDLTTSGVLPRPRDTVSVASVQGKGMWLPVPLLAMASPEAVVAAAKGLGLTHIYLEAGDSGRGFYGQEQAERFLAVAHGSGLKIIAWVLTSLKDVPSDLVVCRQIARFRTASGDGFDGLAPDVEDKMTASDVRTFSQILRAEVGPRTLIVGVIYPVGSDVGQQHPVAGILSRSMDALAPMTYWHVERRTYDPSEIADFIKSSVANVQAAVRDDTFPVEIIGQAYDGFGRNGTGVFNPTGEEVAAALTAAREGGAFGVSLFQWGTTTPSEWEALRQSAWPS